MNKRLIEIVCQLTDLENFLREYWLDILSLALTILSVILMLLEYCGIIRL